MCLECWDAFLDYVIGKLASPSRSAMAETQSQYKEVVLSLVDSLLRKAQFRYNCTELDELDSEGDDEVSISFGSGLVVSGSRCIALTNMGTLLINGAMMLSRAIP